MVITSMYSGSDVDDMNAYFQDDDLWKESPAVKNNTIFISRDRARISSIVSR